MKLSSFDWTQLNNTINLIAGCNCTGRVRQPVCRRCYPPLPNQSDEFYAG